ncbi:YrhA family protein [Bacillus sp. FSL K6-3431]|uniref:YrhA family protein n=1 Tax=Bacillus sp. FSL K6-3431 TaxID=2921500 RepID=UPI0030FBAE6E
MITTIMKDIERIKNIDEMSIRKSASRDNIEVLKRWISQNIKEDLWIREYESLLKETDGLDFNGLVIYNARADDKNNGLIAANEIWYENEWQRSYLFFGDSSISWYCLDIDNNYFLELDKPSGDIMEQYNSFNEMIKNAMNSVL